jgi:hypothetical protein
MVLALQVALHQLALAPVTLADHLANYSEA